MLTEKEYNYSMKSMLMLLGGEKKETATDETWTQNYDSTKEAHSTCEWKQG